MIQYLLAAAWTISSKYVLVPDAHAASVAASDVCMVRDTVSNDWQDEPQLEVEAAVTPHVIPLQLVVELHVALVWHDATTAGAIAAVAGIHAGQHGSFCDRTYTRLSHVGMTPPAARQLLWM